MNKENLYSIKTYDEIMNDILELKSNYEDLITFETS